MKPVPLILLAALVHPIQAEAPSVKAPLEDLAEISDKSTKLDGVWSRYLSPSMRATKFYYQGQVTVTHTDIPTRTVVHHMAGVFSFDGETLKEKMSSATSDWRKYLGTTAVNKVSFDGKDNYSQINSQGHREYWRRLDK